MKVLKHVYAGTPHTRQISAADFKSLGVEGQKQVSWSPANQHTAELDDAAAQRLMDAEPGDWELVEGDDSDGDASRLSGDSEENAGSSGSSSASNASARRRPNPS